MQTNLKLQEFNQERTNFLVRSINDFRAPLTAISGYCGLLLGEEFEPLTSGQRTLLQRMQNSVRRLSRATDTMFQLGVAESGGAALNVERADIGDCIGRVLDELGPVFENKRISVTGEVELRRKIFCLTPLESTKHWLTFWKVPANSRLQGGVLQSRATLPFGSVERTARPNPLLLRIAVSGTSRHLIVSASISTIPARRFQPLTRTKFSKSTHHIPAGKTDLGLDWAWPFAA